MSHVLHGRTARVVALWGLRAQSAFAFALKGLNLAG